MPESVYVRIHPEDWRQLDERFESVKTYTDTVVGSVEDRAAALEKKLDGNGQPGLSSRVTTVETQVKIAASVIGGALVAVGGAIATFLLSQPKPPTP